MSQFAFDPGLTYLSFDLDYVWEPERPAIVAGRFEQLAGDFEDFTPVLGAISQIVQDDVAEHFEKEEGPTGKWKDWAPSYYPKALSENVGILRKTEDLYDAATDPAAYPIIDNDVFIITNDFPDYWAIHNYGGTAGKGSRIPPRPYLWLSDEARAQSELVFELWATERIDIMFAPMTGLFQQRLASGQIGRRIGRRR